MDLTVDEIKKVIKVSYDQCQSDSNFAKVIYELGWEYIEELGSDEIFWIMLKDHFKLNHWDLDRLAGIQKIVLDMIDDEEEN